MGRRKYDNRDRPGAVVGLDPAQDLRATIELAGGLGLNVVVEGVEDEAAWQTLRRLGCSTAQGYFLSRPMPASEVAGWLAEWSRRSARTLAA